MKPSVDLAEENKKLSLLNQKSDLLRRLITIEQSESSSAMSKKATFSDTHSVYSDSSISTKMTASTNYSYATFGNNKTPIHRPRPTFVPKLQF